MPLRPILLGLLLALPVGVLAQESDRFLTQRYDRLHASPLQERFKKIAPMPVGAVYVQRPGEGEEEIRAHFRTMKELGFTALKQIMPVPGWTFADVALIALDEGLIPWWYGQGGWAPITDSLLVALGIPPNTPIADVRADSAMIAYQTGVLRERVRLTAAYEKKDERDPTFRGSSVAFDPQVGGRGLELTDEGKRLFVEWAKARYGTIDSLNHAYNQHHYGLATDGEPFRSWDDFEQRWEEMTTKEYRHLRDLFRFKADNSLENNRRSMEAHAAYFRGAPFRGGGELGLFLSQPWYGVDLEGIARLLTNYGSFYPSMHLAWHFDEVDHEITRPFYMQAALAHDYFKGGWSAPWETSGGPQMFSGAGEEGFTVDEGMITQLLLSHLAAGFRGFGLWAWSARSAGWEGGEYALLDRHNEVTPRARRAGQIGQAMQRYRDELWQARKEPLVGVYVDWENDAFWTAMSVRGRDDFREMPIRARVGVSRAFINADVPFEYVTALDLKNGLGPRYQVIYAPFALAISDEMMDVFADYVEGGGRLVLDTPSAWFDGFGALMPTDSGTVFADVFGATLNEYGYAGTNRPYTLEGLELDGATLDLTRTSAHVVATYDDGRPAVTENDYGEGTAVILGYEASMMAFRPGYVAAEALLLKHALGDYESPYGSGEAIVYRLAAPAADHYILINDGPATAAFLDTKRFRYRRVTDAVTGEELKLGAPIPLERYGGRWLRFEK